MPNQDSSYGNAIKLLAVKKRRRGRGNNKLRNFAVIAVVLVIGIIVAIMVTPAGELLVEASDEVKELFDRIWGLENQKEVSNFISLLKI